MHDAADGGNGDGSVPLLGRSAESVCRSLEGRSRAGLARIRPRNGSLHLHVGWKYQKWQGMACLKSIRFINYCDGGNSFFNSPFLREPLLAFRSNLQHLFYESYVTVLHAAFSIYKYLNIWTKFGFVIVLSVST